jgi:hypothetical protein
MTPVILMAAVVGQCVGGSCSPVRIAPSYHRPLSYPISRPAAPIVLPPVMRTDETLLERAAIREGGLSFWVLGTRMANGKIEWDEDLPFNRRSWANAKIVAEQKRAEAERLAAAKAAEERRKAEAPKPEIQNFGIAPDKMGLKSEEYTAPSAEAQRFVQEAKGETDGPGLLHVTVIGSVDDCAPVVNDLKTHPALAGVRERLMVQDYRPNEWAVDPKLGFQGQGKPTILVQTARSSGDPKGGRVVHRQMSYEGGPEHLAEAIRKADPNYNPSADPGPGRPGRSGCPLGFTSDHWIPIVGAVLVVLFVFSKPKVKP